MEDHPGGNGEERVGPLRIAGRGPPRGATPPALRVPGASAAPEQWSEVALGTTALAPRTVPGDPRNPDGTHSGRGPRDSSQLIHPCIRVANTC